MNTETPMGEPEDCLFFSNIGGVRLGPFRTVEEAEEARVKEEQRQREPGDDDDVPAPPRFTVPPDQDTALLEHAVKKVLEEMIGGSEGETAKKLIELQRDWEDEEEVEEARCDATFFGYRCSNAKGHKGDHQCPHGTVKL